MLKKNHIESVFLLPRLTFSSRADDIHGQFASGARPVACRKVPYAGSGPACLSVLTHLVTQGESSLSAEVIVRATARFRIERILAVAVL
jgi:hypothetical protein